MASPTKRVKVRRKIRMKTRGQGRKRALRVNGSTAISLPLDKPNANELAQAKKA